MPANHIQILQLILLPSIRYTHSSNLNRWVRPIDTLDLVKSASLAIVLRRSIHISVFLLSMRTIVLREIVLDQVDARLQLFGEFHILLGALAQLQKLVILQRLVRILSEESDDVFAGDGVDDLVVLLAANVRVLVEDRIIDLARVDPG